MNSSLAFMSVESKFLHELHACTVEPRSNKVLGPMKITLLYQVSHYIRVKKQRNIKSWGQQNYLVIRGFCYIRPLYNEVPLYCNAQSEDKIQLCDQYIIQLMNWILWNGHFYHIEVIDLPFHRIPFVSCFISNCLHKYWSVIGQNAITWLVRGGSKSL